MLGYDIRLAWLSVFQRPTSAMRCKFEFEETFVDTVRLKNLAVHACILFIKANYFSIHEADWC